MNRKRWNNRGGDILLKFVRYDYFFFVFSVSNVACLPVWPDGKIILSIFGPLQHWIFAQQHKKMTKVGSQFCQILNKVSRNCRTPIIFCQSGEISPNLVTLKRTNFFDLNDSHLAIGKITFQNELSLFRGDVVVVVAVVWTWNVICCLFLSLLKTKIIKK